MPFIHSCARVGVILFLAYIQTAAGPRTLAAQFGDAPIPTEMNQLDFAIGAWMVTGAFRTPDLVRADRTIWYVTDRGVTRFDGRSWHTWGPGQDATADSVMSRISVNGPGTPYQFTHSRTVTRIQDGFALLIDDGRTSGSRLLYYDGTRALWGERSFHAPTGDFGFRESTGTVTDGVLTLSGTGVDRRGERLIRTRMEPRGPDRYDVHTDVSFDGGAHWIVDQIVMEVTRR